jgi:histidinol dehydrogenase
VTLRHGQVVSTRQVPVRRVGVYVPGGLAAYPSSAVMAIVPAQVAGVPEIAACSPPGPSGLPHSGALAVCALLGVEEVYAVGGAQAVAALAIGTASIPAVDMVVGPGNAYVEEAKRRLFGEVGIESLAGPTELVIVADASAPADAAALDLLAQVEHGPGSQSVIVSPDPDVLAAIEPLLPPESGVIVVEADTLETALAFVNAYAPEHLQLMVADPEEALEAVHHAGAIFVGPHSGTAYGDYIAGSNHILPTGGHSRFSSGLSPAAFLRTQEVVELSAQASAALAAPLAALARAEGFVDHARSGEVRASVPADAAPATPGD